MPITKLTAAERELCEALERGETAQLRPRTVLRAEVIRHLVLGLELPVGRLTKTVVPCPAGVRVVNAHILGRIELAYAGTGASEPRALALTGCLLTGGLNGAHGVFSSLSFANSRFRDERSPWTDTEQDPTYSIDLSDSHIQGELNFSAARYCRASDHLFLDLHGAQIDGSIELSRALLKAPNPRANLAVDRPNPAALDLTLARIDGDLMALRGAHFFGMVRMRGTQISGDVWMCGCRIEVKPPEEQQRADCLFMQTARIAGALMLSGWSDGRNEAGRFRAFSAIGDVNLWGIEVGGDAYIQACRIEGSLSVLNGRIGGNLVIAPGRLADAKINGHIWATGLHCAGDLTLGLQIESVSLENARIGGSLDLSELRLTDIGPVTQLSLASSEVGRALRLVREDHGRRLLLARSRALRSLPGFSLVETLWQTPASHGTSVVQVGFLMRGATTIRLDGRSDTFHRIIAQNGHTISSPEAAREYLLLFCAYLLGPAGPFPLLPDSKTFSPRLRMDRAEMKDRLDRLGQGVLINSDEAKAREFYRAGLTYPDLETFAAERFHLRFLSEEDGRYWFSTTLLYGEDIFEAKIGVDASKPNLVSIEMVSDEPTGVIVAGMPRVLGAFSYPPHDGVSGPPMTVEEAVEGRQFVTAAPLDDMQPHELPDHGEQLLPFVQSSVSLRGDVDLEELSCASLDDYGGFSWGEDVRLKLNHFEYRRINWDMPPINQARGGWDRWARRAKAQIFDHAPSLAIALCRKLGANFASRERAQWRMRRDWTMLQYKPAQQTHFNPSKTPIPKELYRPQPLEQIIRVARNEGREDLAIKFEIEKRNIEWKHAAGEWRITAALFGAAAAAVFMWQWWAGDTWALVARLARFIGIFAVVALSIVLILELGLMGAKAWLFGIRATIQNTLAALRSATIRRTMAFPFTHRTPASVLIITSIVVVQLFARDRDFLAMLAWSALIVAISAYLPDIANMVMRLCFGYLKRPVNAILTLVTVFFIGWAGVNKANADRMLVLDVAPVAAVAQEAGNRIIIGSSADGRAIANVHCDAAISEPLYALDVLIPLIDLRQEAKCEVGRAEMPSLAANSKRSVRGFSASASLWAGAKAAYAILGWIVVSLVILTFVSAFRAKAD